MAKSWTYKPSSPPTKQCGKCGKFFHARAKQCPNCEAMVGGTATATRKRVVRRKKVKRPSRRGAPQVGRNSDALTAAVEFIQAAGGVEQARTALDAIERIRRL